VSERLRPKREYSWLMLLPSIAVALLAMAIVVFGGSTEEAESSMNVLGRILFGVAIVMAIVTAIVKVWRESDDGNES
jgi:uncharacterized membrane protein